MPIHPGTCRLGLVRLAAIFLIFLLSAGASRAEVPTVIADPITGFSGGLIPLLSSFEKAKVETTLRGFFFRGDSFPGFEAEIDPSEHGVYLNVAVRDAVEIEKFSDQSERKDGLTHRLVQIPAPKGGGQGLSIQFDYGREVPAKVIRLVDACIQSVVKALKQ